MGYLSNGDCQSLVSKDCTELASGNTLAVRERDRSDPIPFGDTSLYHKQSYRDSSLELKDECVISEMYH